MADRSKKLANRLTRQGYQLLLDGTRSRSDGRAGLGLAMMLAGLVVRMTKRERRLVYSTSLAVGEAIGLRVTQGGEVVAHTVVIGQED
jgi:hypothetical protein